MTQLPLVMTPNTDSTVTCLSQSVFSNEFAEIGKVEALKIYHYRNRYRGKSLFTYRLLTELRIPLPYISAPWTSGL